MRKNDSEEIKINVNNTSRKIIENNRLVRISYLIMTAVFLVHVYFFGISAGYIPTFYGGLMSCIFCAGYALSAFLIIRRNPENTFISLLYLVLIYSVPCCWMGISYVLMQSANIYDYIQFITCLVAMILSIFGIVFFYRNDLKHASIFGFISMIISILGLILGGTAEVIRATEMAYYFPFVGVFFYFEALLGTLPLIYLYRTV